MGEPEIAETKPRVLTETLYHVHHGRVEVHQRNETRWLEVHFDGRTRACIYFDGPDEVRELIQRLEGIVG